MIVTLNDEFTEHQFAYGSNNNRCNLTFFFIKATIYRKKNI